jgi:hypothetical protein
MAITNHLYAILFPTTALVGSQLGPDDFGKHFISGSSKYYAGKLIFVEVDPSYRHPFLKIEAMLKGLTPHEDGKPRSTKYVSTYRVLEHLDYDAMMDLYITTPEGYTLAIQSGPQGPERQPGLIRVYAEINPVSMMLLSDLSFSEFGKFITAPDSRVGAPIMLFTQVELDPDEFLKEFEANPLLASPIPDIHPSVLKKSILELRQFPDKHTKGLSPASPLGKISFKNLRHGFLFASQDKSKFYPMPDAKRIEETNYKFSKFM